MMTIVMMILMLSPLTMIAMIPIQLLICHRTQLFSLIEGGVRLARLVKHNLVFI